MRFPTSGRGPSWFMLPPTGRPTASIIAAAMMVAVGLPVGGNMNQLGPRPLVGKRIHQSLRKTLSVVEQTLKCDAMRDRSVVEEKTDRPAGRQPQPVCHGRVDP